MNVATHESNDQLAAGMTVEDCDEHWLVTDLARTNEGYRVRCSGLSEYVRDISVALFR